MQTVKAVVATEELIIHLGQQLRILSAEFELGWNASAPSPRLFSECIRLRDVQSPVIIPSNPALVDLDVKIVDWTVEPEPVETSTAAGLPFWSSLKPAISEMRDVRFFVIDGEFPDQKDELFRSRVGFEAATVGDDGRRITIHAEQLLTWRKMAADWRIIEWEQTSLRTIETSDLLFESVLDSAIPDKTDRRRAEVSRHQEILVDNYFGGKPAQTPREYTDTRFFPDSVNVHPALSVVDVDLDGWDDLYVCVRWGRNMLFRNQGNGKFEEVAAEYGLDVNGRSTSATFADFDNDGDPDLMLGRSLERSEYLVNENGRFVVSSTTHVNGKLPFLVTSSSAADFNGDGLLDIYFSTYSPLDITSRIQGRADTTPDWAKKFLSTEEAAEVNRRYADYHGFLGQVGPPNVLLVNRGDGRFEEAAESTQIEGYRNTFQATWSDFDSDGDPDLYVANDFAPDYFFRNDGSHGFTDISKTSGTQRMGFGMGAAWGDYDNDGLLDLYVSNMYSKAGRRITSQVPGLDQRMIAGSEGNYLFRNLGRETFERVSGLEAPALTVANAGWSWGGQFTDFDNDGFLDLYVSSGFYTPPANLDNGVDL